jgi:hypothetical protein
MKYFTIIGPHIDCMDEQYLVCEIDVYLMRIIKYIQQNYMFYAISRQYAPLKIRLIWQGACFSKVKFHYITLGNCHPKKIYHQSKVL